jgi:putative hydrolase of the HAD superfamily
MTERAVFFDLAGTLVDFSPKAYEATLAEMASTLGAVPSEFSGLWNERFFRYELNADVAIEEDLAEILDKLGHFPQAELLVTASRLILKFESNLLVPRAGCKDALLALKEAGFKLGLIANQVAPVAQSWPTSELAPLFDDALFSCHVGYRKPDPRIYHLACANLGINPADSVFVGDGGSRELSGAAELGMRAIQMRFVDEYPEEIFASMREPWAGEYVTDFQELAGLLLDSATSY